jgi:hypothetical protein
MTGRHSSRLAALLAGVTLIFGPAGVAAQAVEFAAGGVWQSFSFENEGDAGIETITLSTLPVGLSFRMGSATVLDLRGAWAAGSLQRASGESIDFSGLTDAEVSISHQLLGDAIVASLVGVIPVGAASQTATEAELSAALASELLPFRIGYWGAGGGIGANLGLARRFGGLGLGVSGGYMLTGEFEPVAGDPVVFRPGNMIRASLAADGNLGRNTRLSGRVGLQHFAEDQLGGANLFRPGTRIDGLASLGFPVGRISSGLLYGGFLLRAQGTYLAASGTAPSQDIVFAGGSMRAPLSVSSVLTPTAELRMVRRSDGLGQGFIGGIGTGLEFTTGVATFIPSAKIRVGTAQLVDERETGIQGFESTLTVRFGRVRR